MGCIPSKLVCGRELKLEQLHLKNGYAHHVVSLTSSTYGVLSLDKAKDLKQPPEEQERSKECVAVEARKSSPRREDQAEIINAWELMEGLDEEIATMVHSKRSPKSKLFLRGFSDKDQRSPLKLLNQMTSPRKVKMAAGKENSPKTLLKESNNNLKKPSPRLWASIKGSPKCDSSRCDSGVVVSRRSLGPLFDPEEEVIKKMVSSSSSARLVKPQDSDAFFHQSYKKICPENAVVIYTTTLRGIRKTFEECNVARSIIELQNVEMVERDISMHSAFKEELRVVMGSKEVKVPVVFVKGRLIGGADELVKLDEERKLGLLLDGIPAPAEDGCWRCGRVRFVMCVECSGSCRVVGEDGRRSVKCSKCNENGLIQCPICCLT